MSNSDLSTDDSENSLNVTPPPQKYHEDVQCCCCLAENFSGLRYKCLICYNYDICAQCYDAKAFTIPHQLKHPMQCILTPADCELYYGGETLEDPLQPQSYTCSYCCKLGFTKNTLYAHVSSEHTFAAFEGFGMVLCPLCVSTPGADPNYRTDDLAEHLNKDHDCDEPGDIVLYLNELGTGSEISSEASSDTDSEMASEMAFLATSEFAAEASTDSSNETASEDSNVSFGRVRVVHFSSARRSSNNTGCE